MKKIIVKLQRDMNPENRWIDTKEGWNKYKHAQDKGEILECIKSILSDQDYPEIKPKENTYFTVVRKTGENVRAWRTEEALERLIVVANRGKIRNQYNISEKKTGVKRDKEAIDLFEVDDENNIISLIELKPWESKNSPAYGFVELVKNYFLFKKKDKLFKKKDKLKRILFLAPESYYKNYYKPESIREFFSTVNAFNKSNFAVPFQLAYIKIDEGAFQEIIKQLASGENEWAEAKGTKKFDSTMKVDAKNGIKNENFLKNNWVIIKSENDWPKKK